MKKRSGSIIRTKKHGIRKILAKISCVTVAMLALTAVSSLAASKAQALGQITNPIAIKDAVRGQAYNQIVTIVSSDRKDMQVSLSSTEGIAGWVKFYENEKSTQAIESVNLQGNGEKRVLAKITVPPTTPNGTYKGTIRVATTTNAAKSENISQDSIEQGIDRQVSITVSDKENISFDASLIPDSYDIASGSQLRVRVIYDNRGNVDISPQIEVRIKRSDKTAYNAILPYPEDQQKINPGSIFEIPAMEIPTANLENGNYTASFKISQDDKFSIDKSFNFSIGMVKGADSQADGAQFADNDGFAEKITRAAIASLVTLVLIILLRKIILRKKMQESKDATEETEQENR